MYLSLAFYHTFSYITISSRKYDTKLNLTWNSDESVVTYNRDVYYVFVSERSIGDPQDYTVTILNIPLLVS